VLTQNLHQGRKIQKFQCFVFNGRQPAQVNDQRFVFKKTRTFRKLVCKRLRNLVNLGGFEQQGYQRQISAFDVVTVQGWVF
jgi:hypothetical protein